MVTTTRFSGRSAADDDDRALSRLPLRLQAAPTSSANTTSSREQFDGMLKIFRIAAPGSQRLRLEMTKGPQAIWPGLCSDLWGGHSWLQASLRAGWDRWKAGPQAGYAAPRHR